MPELTPLLTQTPNEVVSIINNCETVTLFDMGIRCNVNRNPSTSTSTDGILSIIATGGTSPYTVYWNGIRGNQRLMGVGQGSYPVTVVDYYGDYTASTICNVIAPTAMPTPVPTSTPVPTPIPIIYPNLCFISQEPNISYGPIQFIWNGNMNNFGGKPTWSGTYNNTPLTIRWISQNSRWEIQGWNFTQGIPVSTNTTNVPDSAWSMAGGQPATITMSTGTCPPFLPLRTSITKQDSTCTGRNNGSIIITAIDGVPGNTGYFYSITGGEPFTTNNIFNNLAPNTYTVVIKDSATPTPNTITNQITINNLNQTTNYTVSIQLINQYSTGPGNKTFDWELKVNPPLKPGMAFEIRIVGETKEYTYTPGSGNISSVTSFKKNTINVPVGSNSNAPFGTFPRTGCNSNYTLFSQTTKSLPIIVGYGDNISGTSVYDLTITTNTIDTIGCSTKLEQIGRVFVEKPISNLPINTTGFTVCETITFAPQLNITNSLP